MSFEVNFDSIIGPTHNFGGLSLGNLASEASKGNPSNPKKAALEGLEKMRLMMRLGIRQGILPPHERPHIPTLKEVGFRGSDADILMDVFHNAPYLLPQVSSASAMWAANTATITPSVDASDKKVHITPANLASKFHRSIEAKQNAEILKIWMEDPHYFNHHAPLPYGRYFSDEGAANHIRLCSEYDQSGVHLFVYGRMHFQPNALLPMVNPARQAMEASQALARTHLLYNDRALFAQQNPNAVDAGVFHNDLIAVGNKNILLIHEEAFLAQDVVIKELKNRMRKVCDQDLIVIKISKEKLSLEEAVQTYFFNSQIVTTEDGGEVLIAPRDCEENEKASAVIDTIIKDPDNPIREVHYVSLKESMDNGGGPACLRLQACLTLKELNALHPKALLNEKLANKIEDWINKHYRDRLTAKDLADPKFLDETKRALDELTKLLDLRAFYSFQKG